MDDKHAPAHAEWAAFVLFGQDNSRAAHFGGEVLELGQPVLYGQHPLGIVDVKGGRECHTRYRRGINVHHAQRWMVGHEMTAAFCAVLPVVHARFHEVADQTGARRDRDVFGLPQGESIHRRGRPRSARIAMAIPHCLRRSVHFDFDSSAEAAPMMCRHIPFRLLRWQVARSFRPSVLMGRTQLKMSINPMRTESH